MEVRNEVSRKLFEETITEMKIQRDQIRSRRANMNAQITKDEDAIKELDEGIEDLQKGLRVLNGGPK